MDNLLFVQDSAKTFCSCIEVVAPVYETSVVELVYMIATTLIAAANVFLIIFIFTRNRKENNTNNDQNRKLSLLKTLVFDYNLKYFYLFYENLLLEVQKLKERDLTDQQKDLIIKNIVDLAKEFRQKFTDILIAVDIVLYQNILNTTDDLVDSITNSAFDEGVNLTHPPKFEELITNKIVASKTSSITILFKYKGL